MDYGINYGIFVYSRVSTAPLF